MREDVYSGGLLSGLCAAITSRYPIISPSVLAAVEGAHHEALVQRTEGHADVEDQRHLQQLTQREAHPALLPGEHHHLYSHSVETWERVRGKQYR